MSLDWRYGNQAAPTAQDAAAVAAVAAAQGATVGTTTEDQAGAAAAAFHQPGGATGPADLYAQQAAQQHAQAGVDPYHQHQHALANQQAHQHQLHAHHLGDPTVQQAHAGDVGGAAHDYVAGLYQVDNQRKRKLPMTGDEASQARRAMNQLLETQNQSDEELRQAEEQLKRAQERVDMARANKERTDEQVNAGAEELTDALLQENTRWNQMYRKMVEYKEKYGNCDVKRNAKDPNEKKERPEMIPLGSWVGQVRLEARRPPGHPDRIEPYKVVALNRIGFNWQPRENYWDEMFEQLKKYLKENNGKMPPRSIKCAKNPLGIWCDTQLDNYRKYNSGRPGGYITREKIDLLDSIGFVWDKTGKAWMDGYEKLKEFKLKNGHVHVVGSNCGKDKTFAIWVAKQRTKYRNWKKGVKPSVTDEQAKMLEELDFHNDKSVKNPGKARRKKAKTEKAAAEAAAGESKEVKAEVKEEGAATEQDAAKGQEEGNPAAADQKPEDGGEAKEGGDVPAAEKADAIADSAMNEVEV